MIRDEATQAQVDAADPGRSTWLAANAGSGKTRVLTDRVARLLLDKVPPEKILCLTYTKAAASEMQNRLFERLGAWAMLPDMRLRQELATLGYTGRIDGQILSEARSLFAQAIETPGGLKVQTIHSFCAAVLRRFPMEARVSPQFTEMDDRSAQLLRQTIIQEMAQGPEAASLEAMAGHLSDPDFDGLARAVSFGRERFAPARTEAELRAMFDLPPGLSAQDIEAQVFLGSERALLGALIPILRASGPNDVKAAGKLANVQSLDLAALPILESTFLTTSGSNQPFTAKIGTFPTKGIRNGPAAPLMPELEALMARVETARNMRLGLAAFEQTRDLHAFAQAFLPRYAEAKEARGWLDFDDLIIKTRDLLEDEKVAAWVLFRLDGGIDHVLVDEAQDTSPVQWDVVEHLTQELTAGAGGARANTARTIFVVGDKKQSIYSFQGADPAEFDRMRNRFSEKLQQVQIALHDAALRFSFRSAGAILDLVDKTFEGREAAGFTPSQTHRAFKSDMPGRVDLWPLIAPNDTVEERHWTDTVDHIDDTHHDVRLAEAIATEIKEMLAGAHALPHKPKDAPWQGRAIEPKDILILVRRRSTLFHEVIRACKAAGLPIAGADRLKVGGELAVRDLGALLSWLALPEDDLSLATALRSPLFGWSEQDIFTLCHGRKEPYLWRTLKARKDQHGPTWDMLRDLRDTSDFLRPFDLIERILLRHGGRARLLSRLGPEAEDGINALLEQAITYESTDIPSLTGFLLWMQTDDMQIKRQADGDANEIRVMTVHGAKGLEAPIVFLLDCNQANDAVKGSVQHWQGTPYWKPSSATQPQIMAPWLDSVKAREAEERDRLLYVAMTRAESWLIVAAAGKIDAKGGEDWHSRIRSAMTDAGAMPLIAPTGAGLRYANGAWPDPVAAAQITTKRLPALPDWAKTPATIPAHPPALATPTGLGGAKALPGEAGQDEAAAMAYGTAVHNWLEKLSATAPERQDDPAYTEAKAVRDAPHLAALFAPGSLAEVPLFADLPGHGPMRGTIDRLVVSQTEVLAVDYKTNAAIPTRPEEVPEGLLRQMGAYAAMLAQIYPAHKIQTAILWTKTADLMELPHDLVTKALATTTSP